MGLEEYIEAVCKICGKRFKRPRGLFNDAQVCESCKSEIVDGHRKLLEGIGKL